MVAICLGLATSAGAQDPTTPRALPDGKSKTVIESQSCCGASRGTVHNSDAAVLAKVPGMAARDGRILRLKLDGNRTPELADCNGEARCEADDRRVHRLVGWWPEQRLYVVSVTFHGESTACLVSQVTVEC